MDLRQLYLNHVAQTSELSLQLEVERAEGVYIFSRDGKRYLDLNSGISVSSLGHCHPAVTTAVKTQVDKYLHTMVYGEHIQAPQVKLATLLVSVLDNKLDTVYFLNGGSEAVEAALKLARKATGRYEVISCRNAYHGSTIGAESLRSDENFKRAFLPGIPGIKHIDFNDHDQIGTITDNTACIILEAVQAEAGIICPDSNYLNAIRKRCDETGTIMILDEIQTGFGRTGHLFAHNKYNFVPDILLLGKAMGGGLPISAFVAKKALMTELSKNPALGHITTFGGHPVCCAAAHASLEVLLSETLVQQVSQKELLIHQILKHPIIKTIRSSGLMMAVELTRKKYLKHVVSKSMELGAIVDFFLFNDRSFRLAPPLIISENQIRQGCAILLQAMDFAQRLYEK